MSIDEGFSVAVYQPTNEVQQILKMLIGQEGVFLKHVNSDNVRTVV
jgi:hypothetical protein